MNSLVKAKEIVGKLNIDSEFMMTHRKEKQERKLFEYEKADAKTYFRIFCSLKMIYAPMTSFRRWLEMYETYSQMLSV
jgi:hypothetical protein